MVYVLYDRTTKAPLSYFYTSSDGSVQDVLKTSKQSYTTFSSESQAEEFLAQAKNKTKNHRYWDEELKQGVMRRLNNMTVRSRSNRNNFVESAVYDVSTEQGLIAAEKYKERLEDQGLRVNTDTYGTDLVRIQGWEK